MTFCLLIIGTDMGNGPYEPSAELLEALGTLPADDCADNRPDDLGNIRPNIKIEPTEPGLSGMLFTSRMRKQGLIQNYTRLLSL